MNNSTQTNNLTTAFDDFGEGQTPLIFIHGFPFDKSSWQPQMAFLQKTHRVIAYDVRGFGESTNGNGTASIQLFADDLINFMDALKVKKAIVCGLSMGGYILLNAVGRFPERFAALVFADTQCTADSDEARAKRKKTILEIEENGLKPFADGFVKNVFSAGSIENDIGWVEKVRKMILSTPVETVTATLLALAGRAETCSSLAKIQCPTLIICGREDKTTPVAQSGFLQKGIENSILCVIEKAAHLSNLEQPGEFNQQILNFVSSLEA